MTGLEIGWLKYATRPRVMEEARRGGGREERGEGERGEGGKEGEGRGGEEAECRNRNVPRGILDDGTDRLAI